VTNLAYWLGKEEKKEKLEEEEPEELSLPKVEAKHQTYKCSKCGTTHELDSDIGKEHLEFAEETQARE